MKKFILSAFVCMIFFTQSSAQDTVYLRKKKSSQTIYTDRAPQTVYVELYGKGLIYSANYDRRFKNQIGGAGFSTGLGVFKVSDFTVVTIPIAYNYLVGGKKGKFFETGIGMTYLNAKSTNAIESDNPSKGTTVLTNLTFGYRNQPLNGGFCFRAGLNLIAGGGYFGPFPYISLGYSF